MRKYLIDQIIFLIVGIGVMICLPRFCGPILTLVFEVMAAPSWVFLCRRILLLPLDLLYGKVTHNAYFATQCGIEYYEFYKGKYCIELKFYYGKNQTLMLLASDATPEEELCSMKLPDKDKKLIITYFRFSKILLDWEYIQ